MNNIFAVAWRAPFFILMWALFIIIKIPVALLGLVVIAYMHRYRHDDYSGLPAWTRPWANPEDWHGQVNTFQYSLPRWYVDKHGIGFRQFWRYHAIRNPANGLRSFELLDLDIVPDLVRFVTPERHNRYEPKRARAWGAKTIGYIAWQGFRAGFKLVHIWNDERHLVIKIGWRVEPQDACDDSIQTIGMEDASFATKFIPYRKG